MAGGSLKRQGVDRFFDLLQRFCQGASGAGHVHTQEGLSLLAELIAGAERHLGLVDHEVLQRHAPIGQLGAVQPDQIGTLGGDHADLGDALPQELLQIRLVVGDIGDGLIQPLLTVVVGGYEGGHAEDVVQPRLGNGHLLVELAPQVVVCQHDGGHAQSAQVKALVGGVADHGVAQHVLAQQAEGGVGVLRRHEVAVDLVHQHEDVVPQADLRHALQLLTGPYPAGGVVGAGEHQHLHAGGSLSLHVGEIEGVAPVLPDQRRLHQLPATPGDHVKQRVVVGHGDHDLVAGVGEDAEHHVHGVDHAGRCKGQMLVVDLEAMALFQPAHYRVIIGLLAHAVAIDRMGGALLHSLHDAGGAGKVHVRHPHGDHIVPAKIVHIAVPLKGEGISAIDGCVKIVFHAAPPTSATTIHRMMDTAAASSA